MTLSVGDGTFYYFKYIKPNDTIKCSPDFSSFDFDEEEGETEFEEETGDSV